MPSHAHHAIQIVLALDGCVAICGKDRGWRESRSIVVRADAEHSFDCNGALGVMLFVDPESSEGAWLAAHLRQDITIVSETRLDSIMRDVCAFAEQPDETEDVAALVRGCVQGLRPGLAPTRRFDPRVATVLDAIRESDDLRMSLDKAADVACLSDAVRYRNCSPAGVAAFARFAGFDRRLRSASLVAGVCLAYDVGAAAGLAWLLRRGLAADDGRA